MEFILTTKSFKGFLKFAYDEQGTLQAYENNATMADVHHKHLQKNFPYTADELMRFRGSGTTVEPHMDVTFENFWKKYNHKKGKTQAQVQWNKLSDEAKFLAITYIPKYVYNTKLEAVAMLYPERYIKYKRWEDD